MKRRLKINLKKPDGTVYGRKGEVKDYPPGTWDNLADSFKKTLDEISDPVSDDETSVLELVAALDARLTKVEEMLSKTYTDNGKGTKRR